MSNSFKGQTQYMQSPMGFGGGGYGDSYMSSGGGYGYASSPYGGGYGQSYGSPFGSSFGGGYGSSMGGYGQSYGSPFGSSLGGGYGTTFGGMGMGGGYGQQQSLVPQYQPTVNDLFSQYFSQQYYGGQAFNPFAATSLFGGGYGGGFGGGGGRGGGMGGRMRRRRQMFEDLFGPEQPTAQPEPLPSFSSAAAQLGYSQPANTGGQIVPGGGGLSYNLPEPMPPRDDYRTQPAVQPYSQPIQPYFGGLPIDFGYSAQPVASPQPAPYMPTYQVEPMTQDDIIRSRAAIMSGAYSAL